MHIEIDEEKVTFDDVPIVEDLQRSYSRQVEQVQLYNMFLIANPRSGSRNAAKFINKYGTDKPLDVQVPFEGVNLETSQETKCRVTIFDVTTQKQLILERIRQALDGTSYLCYLICSASE